MKRSGVFIPFGDDHLAMTITLPEGEARALVGLFPGGAGAPRSFHNSMYAVMSRDLADRGIASVRVEWQGVGDSTGRLYANMEDPPVQEALAAVRFAMEVVGTRALGVGGVCLGGLTALKVADLVPECSSVAVVKLPMPFMGPIRFMNDAAPSRTTKMYVSGIRRLRRMASSNGPIIRFARRIGWQLKRSARPLLMQLVRVRQHADIIVIGYKAERRFDGAMRWINRHSKAGPIIVDDVPIEGSLDQARRMDFQKFFIDRMIDWFDSTLPGEAPSPEQRAMADTTGPAVLGA